MHECMSVFEQLGFSSTSPPYGTATCIRSKVVTTCSYVASFPGSHSSAQIILHMTFDPPERKTEGEPGPKRHVNDVKGREKVERT